MQQVSLVVRKGERDYANIAGDTGPLVYPGAHVWIYRVLWSLTGEGKDVFLAQAIFGVLYLLTLYLVMACYRNAKVRLVVIAPRPVCAAADALR